MKYRTWIPYCIIFVFSFFVMCSRDNTVKVSEAPVAAMFIIYTFEAQTEYEHVEYPILPGETAIYSWAEVVESVEGIKNKLKSLYNYQAYKLISVHPQSDIYENGEWRSGGSKRTEDVRKSRLESIANQINQGEFNASWTIIQPAGDLIEDRLSYTVSIRQPNSDQVHTVRIAGKSGETTVIGTPQDSREGMKKAYFVLVTPLFVKLDQQSDYPEFINLFKKMVTLTPNSPSSFHRNLVEWVNDYTKKTFKQSQIVDADSLVSNKIIPKAYRSFPNSEEIPFVEFDDPPKPVGGFSSVVRNLTYPETARKSGTEGRVLVWINVDTNGEVINDRIVESVNSEVDSAARTAILKTEWTPAIHKGEAVSAWIAVPVDFKLR